MKTKTKAKLKFADMPKDYAGLVAVLPPRPIRDRADYDNTWEVVEALAGFEEQYTQDQYDYMDLLSDLLAAYDQEHEKPRKRLSGLEYLKFLLEEHKMNASDLARLLGVHRSMGAMILNGQRQLSVAHIKILAQRFCVRGDCFL